MQTMVTAPAASNRGPWLRSPAFDGALIFGVLAVALVLGGAAAVRPVLFPVVLAIDIWLFAYPHVTSTYTRIAFDRESARRHWFLLVGLPPLVVAGTTAIAALGGVGGLFTAYYVGQTYHYTRQSYGVARAYRRAKLGSAARDGLTDAVIYAFPIWGLLHRAAQGHPTFYDMPLHLPPVPPGVAQLASVVSAGLMMAWTARELLRWQAGHGHAGHTTFVLSHVLVTTLSYVAIPNITSGWLVVNIWHNAQYLLFVWAFNARRFAAGKDATRPFLSYLSQPRHAFQYALCCVLCGAMIYALVGALGARIASATLPVVLILHLSVNFHHYLVDGLIWTRRGVQASR